MVNENEKSELEKDLESDGSKGKSIKPRDTYTEENYSGKDDYQSNSSSDVYAGENR